MPRWEPIDDIEMNAPPSRRRCGSAALAPCTCPSRLTCSTRANSSGVVSSNPATSSTPAMCTQVSSRPYLSTARSATASIWAGSVTSATTAVAVPPAASISATSDLSPGSPRAATTTFAPCSAKRRAVARPMPLEAPITTTTCSATGLSCTEKYLCSGRDGRGRGQADSAAAESRATRRGGGLVDELQDGVGGVGLGGVTGAEQRHEPCRGDRRPGSAGSARRRPGRRCPGRGRPGSRCGRARWGRR